METLLNKENKIENVFLTGGAGFIGSHLTEKLISNNIKVKIFDNLHRNSIKYTNILNNPLVTFVQGNILDTELLEKEMQGSDMVIHMAAIAGVSSYHKFPALTIKTNLIGVYNVLESMLKNNITRIIDISTSEVFGVEAEDVTEDSYFKIGPPQDKRWSYAGSKISGEQLTFSYAEEYKWVATIVRPFNIYGPRQTGEGAISNFCKNILSNEQLTIENNGSAIRSWCYINDFIDAIMLIIQHPHKSNVEAFNIGNPQATTSNIELAKLLLKTAQNGNPLDEKDKIRFVPMKYTEIKSRYPNISKIQKMYNWSPKVGLEEGTKKTLKWFAENNEKN